MTPESSPPPPVEVAPAAADEAPILANLLELYAHDLSDVFDLSLQPTGRFGYPALARYWRDEGRFPFLVRVGGELAGCALVARGSPLRDDPAVWDVAEFFIARRYRRRGVGAAAAAALWQRFPGTWEVRVLERNAPAQAFWRAAIGAFTRAAPTDAPALDAQGRAWRVFSVESPGAAGAAAGLGPPHGRSPGPDPCAGCPTRP